MARPDYGIDAPDVVRRFAILGIAGILLGCFSMLLIDRGWAPRLRFVVVPLWCIGGTFLLEAIVMLWGSKVGKLRLRDKLIHSLPWRRDELVLDVGCGHGLMLIAAAKQLRSGKAIGIDLWRSEDQAGNSPQATMRNVRIENVADKVELKDGDARKLEFADGTFDIVLSSWALHNIYDVPERATAVREIARVLKPGGMVAIVDIRHTAEYAKILGDCALADIKRRGPNFLFVIPTFVLTARKPH